MARSRITHKDLTYLLRIVFGKDWESTYHLYHDSCGYSLKKIDKEKNTYKSVQGYAAAYSTREMYAYLSGMADFLQHKGLLPEQKDE
ncbi:hypothetical protein FACS189419_05770 [Planctomycetales bacterium]|nr:hypothetical protein FACS189419_05770 [Planctomycetales bacterium]